MLCNFICEDGEAELIETTYKNLKYPEIRKPHEGSTCTFTILQFTEISPGRNKTIGGIAFAESKYCASYAELAPKTLTVTIGQTSVSELDRLLDICLTRLHVEETCQLKLKCSRSQSSYNITIKLVSNDDFQELYDLNSETILKIAASLKVEGVDIFTAGFVYDAFHKFSKATQYINLLHPSNRSSELDKLLTTLHNNLANCHVKVGNWPDAIDLCNMVLNLDPDNVKALYRRGLSYVEIQEYEMADADLQRAKTIEPKNQAVNNKLIQLEEKKKALDAKYAQAMKKLFS